jgi:hypothetical protein
VARAPDTRRSSSALSVAQLRLVFRYLARAFGLPVHPPPSFLATKRLKQSVGEKFGPVDRIHANVEKGSLHSVAVVATGNATGRTVVFRDGGQPSARSDNRRGIDYVPSSMCSPRPRSRLSSRRVYRRARSSRLVRRRRDAAQRVDQARDQARRGAARERGTELQQARSRARVLGATGRDRRRIPRHAGDTRGPLHNDLQTLVTVNRAARDAGGLIR